MAKQVSKGSNNTLPTGMLGFREPADHGNTGAKAGVRKPDSMQKRVETDETFRAKATHAGMGRKGDDSHLGTAVKMARVTRGVPNSASKRGMGRMI
ncbi:MAG TPA: hypothetical protein VNN79_22475 [Actinomycetota bacterium]|nr:hypothetical protein [Actinomycetota bacterium]